MPPMTCHTCNHDRSDGVSMICHTCNDDRSNDAPMACHTCNDNRSDDISMTCHTCNDDRLCHHIIQAHAQQLFILIVWVNFKLT